MRLEQVVERHQLKAVLVKKGWDILESPHNRQHYRIAVAPRQEQGTYADQISRISINNSQLNLLERKGDVHVCVTQIDGR